MEFLSQLTWVLRARAAITLNLVCRTPSKEAMLHGASFQVDGRRRATLPSFMFEMDWQRGRRGEVGTLDGRSAYHSLTCTTVRTDVRYLSCKWWIMNGIHRQNCKQLPLHISHKYGVSTPLGSYVRTYR
ncbi:hypothetical protein F4861DRAFT_515228 [Xylaria intraflava]|nr:hypothetical protein F4861DRAFT_515228 [Xylaria intraflava]